MCLLSFSPFLSLSLRVPISHTLADVTACPRLQRSQAVNRSTMAVSLALNWSPPPSSPLFDEPPSPSGGSGNATTGVTSVPLNASGNLDAPPSGSSPPQSAPLASTSMSSSTSAANPSSSWSAATGAAAQQPRSYAAAAGALGDPQRSFSLPPSAVSQPSPSHQQYPIPPMPSYPSATAGYGQQQVRSILPSLSPSL